MSLGETFAFTLSLRNTSESSVMGVRMMAELQGPGGRYKLGEIVHGEESPSVGATEGGGADVGDEQLVKEDDNLPELESGDAVKLGVETEMKELGLCVLICSVAWETLDGRRTFQRFFKFNVGLSAKPVSSNV
jgi:hypothetical protein